MSPQEKKTRPDFKAIMLDGKTPEQFIVDNVRKFRETSMIMSHVQQAPGKYDVAYYLQIFVNEGYITEEEIGHCVSDLGLEAAEAAVFVSETLPEIRVYMKEQEEKREEEAKRKQLEAAMLFGERWGLERIDSIADYFQKNIKNLTEINRYWENAIEGYKKQRGDLEEKLKTIEDPLERAGKLIETISRLTFFQPSEIEKIFQEEQEHGYVYLDSFLETAKFMYQNANGKDPDLSNYHYGQGEIGLSISFTSIDDPESMKRARRRQAMENLAFGAGKTNETIKPWKKVYREADHNQRFVAGEVTTE